MKWKTQLFSLSNKRLGYIFYGSCVVFCIILGKMVYLSFLGINKEISSINSSAKVEQRYDILDRNGNVLAINIPSTSVYINPSKIKDKDLAVKAIAKTLSISSQQASRLVYSTAPFVWVKRNINKQEELNLKYYGIIGINFQKEQSRFYPYGSLFSHVVGMINIDGYGISGVENSFDDDLKNSNITLSLDVKIQSILRDALLKAKETNEAKAAYGIVINPITSEVLAMVSLPDYNPNDRANINIRNLFSYPTQGVYEFGSITKVFSAALALDSGKVPLSASYDVSKPIVNDRFLIVDFSYIDRSIIVPEILMYSSNIGTSMLMRQVGIDLQKKYLENFGLFHKTSIEIAEKETSLLPSTWNDLNSMTISYGYGLAMSQATFANAFTSVINGGIYRPLTLLKAKEGEYGKETRVISADTSRKIRAILRLTVAFGFGKKADVKGYSVAGKTGSAEKQSKGKYDTNKVIASFAGLFPAQKPEYVIVITIDEPKKVAANGYNTTGGTLASPVFAEIVEKIAVAYGIPKTAEMLDTNKIKNTEDILLYVDQMVDFEIK